MSLQKPVPERPVRHPVPHQPRGNDGRALRYPEAPTWEDEEHSRTRYAPRHAPGQQRQMPRYVPEREPERGNGRGNERGAPSDVDSDDYDAMADSLSEVGGSTPAVPLNRLSNWQG